MLNIAGTAVACVVLASGPSQDLIDTLEPSDGAPVLGSGLATDGDQLIVGAAFHDLGFEKSGAAYIFTRQPDGLWTETAQLAPPTGGGFEFFGTDVAIAGQRAAAATRTGLVHLFDQDAAGAWFHTQTISLPEFPPGDFYSARLAMNADTLLVASPLADAGDGDLGTVRVFGHSDRSGWFLRDTIKSPSPSLDDGFATAVALHGDFAAVSAPGDDTGAADLGAVHLFRKTAATDWTHEASLVPTFGITDAGFPGRLAIGDGVVVVGSPTDDAGCENLRPDCNSGAAFVFEQGVPGVWTQTAKLLASDLGPTDDWFGSDVAVAADLMLIGSRKDRTGTNGVSTGSAFVFRRGEEGVWSEEGKIVPPDASSGSQFGERLTLTDATAFVRGQGVVSQYRIRPSCPADLDASRTVDGADLGLLLGLWGNPDPVLPADLNGDGSIDGADLGLLLGAWGTCP